MRLDNPLDIESVKETLLQGQSSEFWLLVLQSLEQSIARLEGERDGEDIKDLPAEQYKVESELLKAKISYLKHLKEIPATIIQWLQQPDQSIPNFDPYYTVDELKQKEE